MIISKNPIQRSWAKRKSFFFRRSEMSTFDRVKNLAPKGSLMGMGDVNIFYNAIAALFLSLEMSSFDML